MHLPHGRFPLAALASLLLLPLLLSPPPVHARDAAQTLPERYRKWLTEDVIWIITGDEKTEFLALRNDDERDRFMQRFWELRDPEPLTPENEFKDEHYRRIEWANRNLGNDSPRKGCLSERGRVYILLGKPDDTEKVVSANETYPYETWYYGRNTARLGLPGQLRLLFYRPFGTGEYRLMNPVLDKDRLFPPSTQIDVNNPVQLRELLGPEVSLALESVGPGESANTSADIVQELIQPKRIPERIRDQGLALHPDVRTRVTLVSVELGLATLIVPQDDGSSRVHLGAMLPPNEISFLDVGQERWTCRVDAFGEIADAKGVAVAKFDEIATITLPRAELDKRKGHAFAFETVRTLVPGRYHVKLMLQDYAKGHLGRAETDIVVPASAPPSGGARISPFTVAFRVDRAEGTAADAPFTIGGFQLFVPAGLEFQRGKSVYGFGLLREGAEALSRDLDIGVEVRQGGESRFSATAQSPAATRTGGQRPILVSVPTASLAAGRYELTVTARSGSATIATATSPLVIVDSPRPDGFFLWSERRTPPPEVAQYNRGVQLLSKGDLPAAEQAFRISLDHRKGFRPSQVQLARVLAIGGKTDDAETLLARVLADDPDDYDALVTRGSLRIARGDWAGATSALERAISVGMHTKEILNALGEAAIGLNDRVKARRWFEESLKLDPGQDIPKKRLAAIGS